MARTTKYRLIDKPNMHGWTATKYNRKVEVVRCYSGEWTVFYYRDGVQVVLGFNPPTVPMQIALEDSKAFLNFDLLPVKN